MCVQLKSQRIVADFVKATWYIYASSIFLHMAANIIHVYFPKILGSFTDELYAGHLSQDDVIRYAVMLLAAGAGFAIVGGFAQYLVMYVGRLFEFVTRRKLFHHFTGLSEHFYANNGVGKLLSYFMNDITSVRESISMGVNQTANTSMLLISAVTMMLLSDIPYYLIFVCIAPLLMIPIIVMKFGSVIRVRSLKVQESLGKMTETAEEQFGGIRVTKTFAAEETMNRRFGSTVDHIRDNQLHLVRVSSLFQALLPFLGSISLITALVLGGYLAVTGRITLGSFVALTLYIRMMMNPLQQFGNVINTMQRARASLERLNELFSKRPDITEDEQAAEVDLSAEPIRIRNLSYSYPGAPKEALHGIDLVIKPGMTIGVVGKTGSGKTTLLKLLLRTYDPPPGTILIGDHDIREVSLGSLRSQIGYVPQDGFLFSTTIRDNIVFCERESTREEVETAAKQAQIYDNIMDFPEQFETKLGDRGVTLSGGQRQRTSLARGLIRTSPVMILDDSVSSVDAVTETNIIDTLQAVRHGKTTILAAHRISALKHADEIIVLGEGKIVERGTHEQLLAHRGIYRTLYDIQEEGSQYGSSHTKLANGSES